MSDIQARSTGDGARRGRHNMRAGSGREECTVAKPTGRQRDSRAGERWRVPYYVREEQRDTYTVQQALTTELLRMYRIHIGRIRGH
jgi:hypothetical protein